MAQHDNKARSELGSGELDAAYLRRLHNVAGYANDEQITQALIEYDLGRDTRVRTTEDNGEWFLSVREFPASPFDAHPVQRRVGNEALVALTQAL